MKTLLKFGFALCVAITLMACSSSDGAEGQTTPPAKPSLKLLSSLSAFASEGGQQTLRLESTADWTAEVDQQWVKVSPAKGRAGSGSLTVKVDENASYDERNAQLVIRPQGGDAQRVQIISKQKDALIVTSERKEVASEGGEVELEVKANINFEVAIEADAQEWVKKVSTRGLKSEMLKFKVSKNERAEKRAGKITIKSALKEEVFTIFQSGETPELVLTQSKYELDHKAQSVKIELRSNVDYEMLLPDATWLKKSTTRSLSTYTHYIDVEENKSGMEREAEVKFVYKKDGRDVVERVAITQGAEQMITLKNSLEVFSEAGGNQKLKFESTGEWTAEVDQQWCTVSPKQGHAGSGEVSISVAANSSYDELSAKLTLKTGSVEKVVTVTQKQTNALLLTSNRGEVSADGGELSVEVKANVTPQFAIAEDGKSWVSQVVTRGLTTTTYRFKVEKNESFDKRETRIMFSGAGLSETYTIYQQGDEPRLVLTQSAYELDRKAQEVVIELKSNVSYEMQLPMVDWITERQTRAMSTYTHRLAVSANETGAVREAEVVFTWKKGGKQMTERVKIRQTSDKIQKLRIIQEGNQYTLPTIIGDKFFGYVLWGDASQREAYSPGLKHIYGGEADKSYQIEVEGSNAEEVKFANIKGLIEVDFSEF